jgi:hypothetical protein
MVGRRDIGLLAVAAIDAHGRGTVGLHISREEPFTEDSRSYHA